MKNEEFIESGERFTVTNPSTQFLFITIMYIAGNTSFKVDSLFGVF